MSIEEAYCAFPYEAVLEDGMVLLDEHDALIAHLTQAAHIASDPEALIKAVDHHAQELGETLLETAGAALPKDMRLGAYEAAARLALADNDMGPDEAVFLERARSALRLDAEQARAILDAL